jgi:hypothetical protein
VKIRLLMVVRDMFPETINRGYELAGLGKPAVEHTDIHMFREVDWPAVPRKTMKWTSASRRTTAPYSPSRGDRTASLGYGSGISIPTRSEASQKVWKRFFELAGT